MLTVKKKIISKYSPGLISLLLMAQGACVPQKTPISLSAKPAVTQRAPQDFIYPKIQITNTKGEIKILQARPLTAEEENIPEPAPFSIKKISHAEMVYGQYVGKDYGDAMAVDVYVEQGTTSQIRSKILGNTCGVNWVMTYVEDPFTATDNYMYGGQRKRISTYISNIDTLKNSSWTYRIEDVLDSSVAYDFPVTLYNGSDAYCGGNPSPSPSPSPSSNPSPTPSPSANPTPSPEPSSSPTLTPYDPNLQCTPNFTNQLERMANELNHIHSKIPGAPPLQNTSATSGFQVQFVQAFAGPVLLYVTLNAQSVQQAARLAYATALTALNSMADNKISLEKQRYILLTEMNEALQAGDKDEFKRLRKDLANLAGQIADANKATAEAEKNVRSAQNAQDAADNLNNELAVAQSEISSECATPPTPSPNPTPTPSVSETPNIYPTAEPGTYPSNFDGKGASQVPNLNGKRVEDADRIIREHGFSEGRQTISGKYTEYKHPDGSQIHINNQPGQALHGRVSRVPSKNSKGYRYNPDGTVRSRPAGHDTGERVIIP